MAENTSKQTVKNENENKYKWTDEIVEDLLKCLEQCKTTVESKGKDLNTDKPRQYNADLKISQYVCIHIKVIP